MKLGMQEIKLEKYSILNKYSIGIEIHNPGHENGYEKFSNKTN